MLVDADQGGFQVSALRMGRLAWPAPGRYIDVAPVEERKEGAVALHDGISGDERAQGGLVKVLGTW